MTNQSDGSRAKGLAWHERRVRFLGEVSSLLGVSTELPGLSSGLTPDVVRVRFDGLLLFVGDAKHTEGPSNSASKIRIFNYLAWLATYWPADAVVAICCGSRAHAGSWLDSLSALAADAGLPLATGGVEHFATGYNVAWVRAGSVMAERNAH